MDRVGRAGVVTMEESRTAEDHLYVVEGMQFDRGYISPYFVTDPERMVRARSDPPTLRLRKPSAHGCVVSISSAGNVISPSDTRRHGLPWRASYLGT